MNSKKSSKPFGFGFSHSGSANKSKSILESEDQQRQKPPSLDYFSDEETQPKKRKLIKLDDPLEEQFTTSSNKLDDYDLNKDYVGNLEDDKPPPPRTSTGIQGFVPQGYGYNVDKEVQSSRNIKSEVQVNAMEENDPLDAFMLDIDNQ
ncbi:5541_t:CDS:2, partial [Funneliformis mosseae]